MLPPADTAAHLWPLQLERTLSLPADDELIERLLAGDEQAFALLVDHLGPAMARVAHDYCGRHGAVDEVVQETWMAVLEGLPRFQRRSSLKTWIFRILTNRAKTRGKKEARSTPLSAMEGDGGPVEPERFAADGHWASPPDPWTLTPDRASEDAEIRTAILAAIDRLPERQRTVVLLRDVQGLSSTEVCSVLDITDTNQRVLLHRARHRVRALLADFMAGER